MPDAFQSEVLADMLWEAYAAYVVAHCPKRGERWVLDEMAAELQDQAVSYQTHRTF